VRGQRHARAALYPRERPGAPCTGGWVAPRQVWTGSDNLGPTGIRSPDRPARRLSLYRLRYPLSTRECLEILEGDFYNLEGNETPVPQTSTPNLGTILGYLYSLTDGQEQQIRMYLDKIYFAGTTN